MPAALLTSSSEISLKALYLLSVHKREMPYYKRAIQGWLGGAYLSLGGLVASTIAGGFLSSNAALAKLIYAVLFPIGLMLIVFAQVDLFTSNCLIVALGVFYDTKKHKKCLPLLPKSNSFEEMQCSYSLMDVLNVLINSWLWNLIGSLCMAYFLAFHGNLLTASMAEFVVSAAQKKLALSSDSLFLRAVSANWLVCLAVFFANGTTNILEKAFVVWFPIFTFVGIGLEHSVANMFTIPCAILIQLDTSITWAVFFTNNIIHVTLGNIVGGLIVAVTFFVLNSEYDLENPFANDIEAARPLRKTEE